MKPKFIIRLFWIITLLSLQLFFAASCDEGEEEAEVLSIADTTTSSETTAPTTLSIKLVVDLNLQDQKQLFTAVGTFSDVEGIVVIVRETEGEQTKITETVLLETPEGSGIWEGLLDELPIGVSLDFEANAYNAVGEVIFTDTIIKTFTGNETEELGGGGTDGFRIEVTFEMESVDDGVQPNNPIIESAVIPEQIETGSSGNIIIFRISHPTEVEYELDVLNGTITSPTTGTHDPSNDLLVMYTAPGTAGEDIINIKVKDPALTDTVGSMFIIHIVQADVPVDIDIIFGPAITAMEFIRGPDKLMISASTDPEDGLSYLWSGTDSFSALSSTSNPLVIDNFTDQMAGEVAVTVTDSQGLQAGLSRFIGIGDFPYLVETPDPDPDPVPNTPQGTFLDTSRGLLWQDDGESPRLRGFTAQAYCKRVVDLGGYTDWRLPTLDELKTAYEIRESFNSYLQHGYWSSTTYHNFFLRAWYLRFNTGTERVGFIWKKHAVRCVRDWE